MDCEELVVDMRKSDPKELAAGRKMTELLFKLNHTMPMSEEYSQVLKEIFGDNIGENTYIAPPLNGAAINKLRIGSNVFIKLFLRTSSANKIIGGAVNEKMGFTCINACIRVCCFGLFKFRSNGSRE